MKQLVCLLAEIIVKCRQLIMYTLYSLTVKSAHALLSIWLFPFHIITTLIVTYSTSFYTVFIAQHLIKEGVTLSISILKWMIQLTAMAKKVMQSDFQHTIIFPLYQEWHIWSNNTKCVLTIIQSNQVAYSLTN